MFACAGRSRTAAQLWTLRRFCASAQQPLRIPRPFPLSPTERKVIDFFTQLQRDNMEQLRDLEFRMAGGWVRDKLLNCPEYAGCVAALPPPIDPEDAPGDIDIALSTMTGAQLLPFVEAAQQKTMSDAIRRSFVVKANPEQSKHLETVQVRVHGCPVDLVNLRKEDYAEHSRIPVMQIGTPWEDAQRRDFTLNALFYHLQRDEVEDYLGGRGLQDLAAGELHTPTQPASATLLDDPLRALRALRFSARFGFSLGEELLQAMRLPEVVRDLRLKVSRARVRKELWMALQHSRPEPEQPAPELLRQVSTGPGRGPIDWIGSFGMQDVIFPPLDGGGGWLPQQWEDGAQLAATFRQLLHRIRFQPLHNDLIPVDDAVAEIFRAMRSDLPVASAADLLLAALQEPVPQTVQNRLGRSSDLQTVMELVCLYHSQLSSAVKPVLQTDRVLFGFDGTASLHVLHDSNAVEPPDLPKVLLPSPVRLGTVPLKSCSSSWQHLLVQESLLLTSSDFRAFSSIGVAAQLAASLVSGAGAAATTFSTHPALQSFCGRIWTFNRVAAFFRLAGAEFWLPSLLVGCLMHHRPAGSAEPLESSVVAQLNQFAAEHSFAATTIFRAFPNTLSAAGSAGEDAPGAPSLSQLVMTETRLGVQGRFLSFVMDTIVLGEIFAPCALHKLHWFIEGCAAVWPPPKSTALPASPKALAESRRRLNEVIHSVLGDGGGDPAAPSRRQWLKHIEDVLEPLLVPPISAGAASQEMES